MVHLIKLCTVQFSKNMNVNFNYHVRYSRGKFSLVSGGKRYSPLKWTVACQCLLLVVWMGPKKIKTLSDSNIQYKHYASLSVNLHTSVHAHSIRHQRVLTMYCRLTYYACPLKYFYTTENVSALSKRAQLSIWGFFCNTAFNSEMKADQLPAHLENARCRSFRLKTNTQHLVILLELSKLLNN